MATNQDRQYIPKLREILGTQEEATELNNGGATKVVLNRRVRSPTGNKSKPASSNINKDG